MNSKVNFATTRIIAVLVAGLVLLGGGAAAALAQGETANEQPGLHERVLYSFSNAPGADYHSVAGLISDAADNLYGTTDFGGSRGGGAVFELSPQSGGGWTQTVLHNFHSDSQDGSHPWDSLIFDASGNLYGTTRDGGVDGNGSVFELSPQPGGSWSEQILYSFGYGPDGSQPFGCLVFDKFGNLYGTTEYGGADSDGTVFELSPQSGAGWSETQLYSFTDVGDGHSPYAGLIFDEAGNLYGTTAFGGTSDGGTVFQLVPQLGGGWYERILYDFQNNSQDGNSPYGGLVIDMAGNLYGTTEGGGNGLCQGNGCGTVFELSPQSGGSWAEKVLHNFQENGTDGNNPYGGLTMDAAGNLYGTTTLGGANLVGIVFELSPRSGANWHEKVLHTFQRGMTDGFELYAGLLLDSSGNLYGTTMFGGDSKNFERGGPVAITPGTVFEVVP